MCAVLIVHTSETQDWATYLKLILEASHHFSQDSITLFYVNEEKLLQDEDHEMFFSSKCILLLISVAFVDLHSQPQMQDIFKKVLHPPCKVVAFMCGMSESDGLIDYFEHWDSWQKLDSEDEPSKYISTVLELISQENDCDQNQEQLWTECEFPPLEQIPELYASEEPEELDQSQQFHPVEENSEVPNENPTQAISPTVISSEQQTCLTVQPQRILCGTQVTVYIIMAYKLHSEASMEVEFNCEHSTKRVLGVSVNEYTVRAQSPDMPAGDVLLHLYANDSIVCSSTITYYTEMEEISSYLEKLMDPIQFLCQAFHITSNASEALDDLFTDGLKNQMPAHGLQVFGVGQLEQNTLANQQNVELPTLLHFSAKYGLKKLTSMLLQCPGALQAYSVVNKNGDCPNTLAEKSGFSDLKQLMDNYFETADLVKTQIEESMTNTEDVDIYESMANTSQNITDFSIQEDIYESMMKLNPEMRLYEDQDIDTHNTEEAMLRIFFKVKPEEHAEAIQENLQKNGYPATRANETEEYFADIYDDEEDPYKMCCPDDIYDTVDDDDQDSFGVLNRPPAPIPRPSMESEPEENKTYISTVFSSKESLYSVSSQKENEAPKATVWPVEDGALSSAHDPYAGMKTPGQRQLISLQERVKVGALTVEEAVQEFKAWKFDQDKRSQSIRFQQDNLQKLRDSITRRHKERGRSGKTDDLEITAPMQRSLQWGSHINVECSVYERTPRSVTQAPLTSRPPQRGSWQTGSASSTSSSGSNRLSTLSTISYSSGADGELEEPQEAAPPRPPRPNVEVPPTLPPPRLPRRTPERFPESMLHERYVSSPTRALPQLPPQRPIPPPPVPRRSR